MDSPDKFFFFTATGWTAIGSIVGAASILILSVLNFLNLRAANNAADAAREQAKAAKDSLAELQQKSLEDHLLRRETAIAVAREISRNARNWKSSLSKIDPGNDIALLPKNWSLLNSYAALFQPQITADIANFEGHVADVEHQLVTYLSRPHSSRSVVGPAMNIMTGLLESVATMAEDLARLIVDGN